MDKLDQLMSMFPSKAYSFNLTSTTGYVPLATASTPAMNLWVYNTSAKIIEIRVGDQITPIPAGQVAIVTFVKDLSYVSFRTSDAAAGTVVYFRYEV